MQAARRPGSEGVLKSYVPENRMADAASMAAPGLVSLCPLRQVTLGRLKYSNHRGECNVAVSADLAKLLDKQYEESDLNELIDAPVSAIAGISDGDAELLQKAFNISTVGDLGRNKYFRAAQALSVLAEASK
jgi:hypothetical protein